MVILGLQGSFGIFFKPIAEDMGWSRAVTSGAFSFSQIIYGISGIIIGVLSDRFGPRVAVTVCGLFSVLGCLLMSQVHSIWQIYLFFGVLIGVGNSVYVPLLSTISKWFVQRRSMMSGIAFAGAGFGNLILPLLVNWLISSYSWRLAYIVMGFIILVFCVSAAQFLKRSPNQMGQAAYGSDEAAKEEMKSDRSSFSFKEAMHTRQFWLFGFAFLCFGFCFASLQLHIVPYATDLGISATGAATILAFMGAITIIGQIGWGSIGDKIGYKKAFLIGMVFVVLAVLTVLLARELWVFLVFAVFLGLAFGDSGTQQSPITAWLFGLSSHGVILGFFAFSFTVGAAIGPIVFGYIYDVTGSYQYAFWIAGIVSIITVILTTLIKKTDNPAKFEIPNSKLVP